MGLPLNAIAYFGGLFAAGGVILYLTRKGTQGKKPRRDQTPRIIIELRKP